MIVNGLRDVLNKFQPDTELDPGKRLFRFVEDVGDTGKEIPYMKPGDFYRASGLGHVCIREEVLASKYETIRVQVVPPRLQITFDIGHVLHNLYRDQYYGPMGLWAGAWECLHCGWNTDESGDSSPPVLGKTSGRLARMPLECGGCGAPFALSDKSEMTYGHFREWQIRDPENYIQGHADGWILGGYRQLVDLKSQSSASFPTRRKADPKHVIQVLAYERMCQDTEGAVWYMNKSPWGDPSAFVRGFSVPYDYKQFERNIAKPMRELQNGLAGGTLPVRLCPNMDCSRAKECQMHDVCWES